MIEVREAPVPVRWAWLGENEIFNGVYGSLTDPWWMEAKSKDWMIFPYPKLHVELSNGQVVIVRAKK